MSSEETTPKTFTRHVNTTISAQMSGSEWQSSTLPEIQRLAASLMPSSSMCSAAESNSLQRKLPMCANATTLKKTSGRLSTSETNKAGFLVISPCATRLVQPLVSSSEGLTGRIELMPVLFTIQTTKQLRRALTFPLLDPLALWSSKLKMHSILLAGIIKRKTFTSLILPADTGKWMKTSPSERRYY